MKLGIGVTITLLAGVYMISGCAHFGTVPDKDRVDGFKLSKQFNPVKEVFENRRPDLVAQMKKDMKTWEIMKEWFKDGNNRVPGFKLPEVKPDFEEFLNAEGGFKIIWFGHSSFLVNMNGTVILVDPIFSGSAAPVNFLVKRFQEPVVELSELPPVDYVLISHDHYDHLDMHSVKFFKDKEAVFIASLGVSSHLTGWGIPPGRIIEKDWWESHHAGDLEFIATPAQHFSGRDGFHGDVTLWASWVVRNAHHNIYFSGDSGYDTHFKAIGDKYGPFDLAFIESGQYDVRWEAVHLMPDQFVKAYQDLKAEKYFPVHWGMFELALHAWNEPVEILYGKHLTGDVNLVAPKIGQIIDINRNQPVEKWWLPPVAQEERAAELSLGY